MAGPAIVRSSPSADLASKWLIIVIVIIVVDVAWLAIGALMKRMTLTPATERAVNIVMGATIALSALAALL